MTVLTVLFLAAGAALLNRSVIPGLRNWQPVEASVTNARVCKAGGPMICRYMWDGGERSANVADGEVAAPLLIALSQTPDALICCMADARNPEKIVIGNAPPEFSWLYLWPLVLGTACLMGLLFLLFNRHAEKRGGGRARALCLLLAAAMLAAGTATVLYGLDMKLRSGETAGWPECPCTILYSDIKAEMHVISSDNQSEKLTYVEYSPEIYFRYEVDGRTVISPFYERIADSYSMRTMVEKIVNSFPPGTRSVCYVNPDNPTEAVLAKGGFSFLMYGLIGSGLALAALMLMLAASLSCRSRLQNWN